MTQKNAQLPTTVIPWIDANGKPLDQFRRFMVLFAACNFGPLTNAANDAAAAKAGVAVGQLYQDNGIVRIRLS